MGRILRLGRVGRFLSSQDACAPDGRYVAKRGDLMGGREGMLEEDDKRDERNCSGWNRGMAFEREEVSK